MEKPWTTGTFKDPVIGPIWLGLTNLTGDGQADLKNHGGPDKAVNAYPYEHYAYWAVLLGQDPLPPAALGENFTTVGAIEADVCVGDVFDVGEARVQISQPRQPCWKQARRWREKDLAVQMERTGRTGWYFRVLREGVVEAGNPIRLLARPHPEWTVAAANAVMHDRQDDLAAAAMLAACPALSASWRLSLGKRVATGQHGSVAARLDVQD